MMKTDRKTKYVIAGILFFLLAVWNAYQAYANIRQIMLVMSHYFYPRLFLPVVYNIVLVFFSILFGCWALKQRERGKAWDIVGLLYLLYLLRDDNRAGSRVRPEQGGSAPPGKDMI